LLGQQDFWLVKLGPDALSRPPWLTTVPQTAAEITDGFKLFLHGVSNVNYVVETSFDFLEWTPLRTNRAAATAVMITDPSAPPTQRLYRARLQINKLRIVSLPPALYDTRPGPNVSCDRV
jgi:hypothetical protein